MEAAKKTSRTIFWHCIDGAFGLSLKNDWNMHGGLIYFSEEKPFGVVCKHSYFLEEKPFTTKKVLGTFDDYGRNLSLDEIAEKWLSREAKEKSVPNGPYWAADTLDTFIKFLQSRNDKNKGRGDFTFEKNDSGFNLYKANYNKLDMMGKELKAAQDTIIKIYAKEYDEKIIKRSRSNGPKAGHTDSLKTNGSNTAHEGKRVARTK